MNSKTTTKVVIALFILIPFGMFLGSIWISQHQTTTAILHNGTALPSPQNLPEFQLKDMNGVSFTKENLKGHWSLLFFGFTHCPAVCPTTLSELKKAIQLMNKESLSPPHVIFISIDPDNDSSVAIKKYLAQFNPHFRGATGTQTQLTVLTKALGVMFAKVPLNKSYSMSHSNLILIINPEAQWAGVLTPPHKASEIAQDVEVISKP